jgi:hypothetical protein
MTQEEFDDMLSGDIVWFFNLEDRPDEAHLTLTADNVDLQPGQIRTVRFDNGSKAVIHVHKMEVISSHPSGREIDVYFTYH